MESIWNRTVYESNSCHSSNFTQEGELPKNLHVKNVVIGGGMTGLLIAYLLQESGEEVVVLEAEYVGAGQTQYTTAKITAQHGLIYKKLQKNAGEERAKGYYRANTEAIDMYEEIIRKEQIECGFRRLPAYLYATTEAGKRCLEKEYEALQLLDVPSVWLREGDLNELPFWTLAAIQMPDQAQFHPLLFLQALRKKLTVYEHIRVLSFYNEHILETTGGIVTAEHVIFACHYPFPVVPGFYFMRQHQSRSYVMALEGKGVPEELSGMYYGIEKHGISLRSEAGKLIFGAGANRTGKVPARVGTAGFCYLRKRARECYPNAHEVAIWAAQDCMPHDGIPFIGQFSYWRRDWYVATGFQKWGMSSAMVAAILIRDAILGKQNPYRGIFTPQRLLIRAGAFNFLADAWESVKGLIKGLFVKKERRCTHMGCALTYNEQERSWDCSCHGSRFTDSGGVLNGPANHKKDYHKTE